MQCNSMAPLEIGNHFCLEFLGVSASHGPNDVGRIDVEGSSLDQRTPFCSEGVCKLSLLPPVTFKWEFTESSIMQIDWWEWLFFLGLPNCLAHMQNTLRGRLQICADVSINSVAGPWGQSGEADSMHKKDAIRNLPKTGFSKQLSTPYKVLLLIHT